MAIHQIGHRGSLTWRIVVAMALGVTVGWYWGASSVFLGVVGKTYIQLIKVIAIPLVLCSIVEAVIATDLTLKTASRWLLVITINTTCALALGLSLTNIVRPGDGFPSSALSSSGDAPRVVKEFSLSGFLSSIIPESVVQPFADNNVLSIVLLALLIGLALRAYLREPNAEVSLESAQRVGRAANGVINKILLWLVSLVPIAVFCVTARTVGEYGFAPFRSLASYVGLGLVGLLLQIVLVYPLWIHFVGKIPLKSFWRAAHKPAVYAFGTNSSLATIPVTLEALDGLHVPKAASRLGTCIGTNFNNDGIILYEAMAVLFVAQASGIDLSLGEQVFAALISLAAAIGVAGVPEAGVVSLSLVLSAVGLPLEMLPLLLTVDWIVARMRSVTNVMSDMTVSIAVAGLSERKASHG